MPIPQEIHSLWNRPESLLLTLAPFMDGQDAHPTRNSLFVEQAGKPVADIGAISQLKDMNWENPYKTSN